MSFYYYSIEIVTYQPYKKWSLASVPLNPYGNISYLSTPVSAVSIHCMHNESFTCMYAYLRSCNALLTKYREHMYIFFFSRRGCYCVNILTITLLMLLLKWPIFTISIHLEPKFCEFHRIIIFLLSRFLLRYVRVNGPNKNQ